MNALAGSGGAPIPDPLPLWRLPFVFEQDGLLGTGAFMKEAEARGFRLDLGTLARLHRHRILVPLYRVDDEADPSNAVPPTPQDRVMGHNVAGWAMAASAGGCLRDPWREDVVHPYEPDEPARGWWDGYVWSPWQLLDLHHLTPGRIRVRVEGEEPIGGGWVKPAPDREAVEGWRQRTILLASVAGPYLPRVLRRLRSSGGDLELVHAAMEDLADGEVLGAAGAAPEALRVAAEGLLLAAHAHDPLQGWLPLVRHVHPSEALQLRGDALHAWWLRAAAECLLLCYESLASAGTVDPLPALDDPTGLGTPLDHRLAPPRTDLARLEPVLARFGLSPVPAVLLLVEGKSERRIAPQLLEELGVGPDRVRVQSIDGVGSYVREVVKFGVAPRLGRFGDDMSLLLSPPTSLRLLLDAEGRYRGSLEVELDKLRRLVREEIEQQGHSVDDVALAKLVDGEVLAPCFEFANFTVGELADAVAMCAPSGRAGTVPDRDGVIAALSVCRDEGRNLKAVLGPWHVSKVDLSDALLPLLRAELESGKAERPILSFLLGVANTAIGQPRGLTAL